MSIVTYKVCDKCGRQIYENPTDVYQKKAKIYYEILVKTIKPETITYEEEHAPKHLCDYCYEKLVDFFYSKK